MIVHLFGVTGKRGERVARRRYHLDKSSRDRLGASAASCWAFQGMTYEYDIMVFGGGIAGLWLGNTLSRAGYNVIVIESDKLGAGQTLASQGMIHGGQKYLLQGILTPHASAAARMPQRWQASLQGRGDVDLTSVEVLSEIQIMWPAGSLISAAAVLAAANSTTAGCKKLEQHAYPEVLRQQKRSRGPVYALPEKVLDMRSVILALAGKLPGRVLQGKVSSITPEGEVTVSGQRLCAKLIVFAAGAGNELALEMLGWDGRLTQRRPLRQVMVRPLPYALFAHGIAASRHPRVTVTSHSIGRDGYVWYLGGAVAETGANMDAASAVRFAADELKQIFPEIDWDQKEWATWHGDRAEPLDGSGHLPAGPVVHQFRQILMVWPTKLTFTPALSDLVLQRLEGVTPAAQAPPPPLPAAGIGAYPWEVAKWRKIA
jgi:glycine/D-amino acid oxidase-like deaminating enzyme